MRIGIEAQRIFRKKKHGMDIYARELIKALQNLSLQHEIFVFYKRGETPDISLKGNFHLVEVPGVTYFDWEQIFLPLYLQKYKIDLLHCTSNTAPILTNVRLITTIHDVIYLNDSFKGGSIYQRLGHHYRKLIVPLIARNSQRVITVSNFEKNTIASTIPEIAKKTEVVYNGVSQDFRPMHRRAKAHWRNKLDLPSQFIFFLGNLVPKKNMPNMMAAYEQYVSQSEEPLPLVVAEVSKKDIEPLVSDKAILDHIVCTGYLGHSELRKVYGLASLFIYPSLRESFGIPIIEAMAAGTPVITSDRSSMPEIADGCAYLVNPSIPAQIASAISYALENSQFDRIIQKGIQNVQRFTWTKAAMKTLNLYEQSVTKTATVGTATTLDQVA